MKQPSLHQLACPKCQSEEIISHGKLYALYPSGCVAILSLPVAWLHRESTPHQFECRACGNRFSKRTFAAKIAYAGLWLSVGIIIWWIVMMIWR